MDQRLERLEELIRFTEENLEYLRGTVYERYTERLLRAIIAERDEYLSWLRMLN